MSTTVYESGVVPLCITHLWTLVRGADLRFTGFTRGKTSFPEGDGLFVVGGERRVMLDGTCFKPYYYKETSGSGEKKAKKMRVLKSVGIHFRLLGLSEDEHKVTFEMVPGKKALTFSGAVHTITLSRITMPPGYKYFRNLPRRTFMQWQVDFSNDVPNDVKVQQRKLAQDAFKNLQNMPQVNKLTVYYARQKKIIDGDAVAAKFRRDLKTGISKYLKGECNSESKSAATPTLAVVLVGARKDSATYVRMKTRACHEVGIRSVQVDLSADISQDELIKHVRELNARDDVHGILVQLPLPKGLDQEAVLLEISPEKDVDGLHHVNAGLVMQRGVHAPLIPCTPLGCVRLLQSIGMHDLSGKHAVVIGRSVLVGKPVAQLLLSLNATVTMCHSRTANLEQVVGTGDIVVVAVGRAEMVKGLWLKRGAVVLDVGINAVEDNTRKLGHRLVGDVEFESAVGVALRITPVPGGCGPLTVAMLLNNTVRAFTEQTGIKVENVVGF